jgi:hypothetical protein
MERDKKKRWLHLESTDRYDKGDELYDPTNHRWVKITKELYGMYHDTEATTPARRLFTIPVDEKIEAVDPDKKPKPKFDVLKWAEEIDTAKEIGSCRLLVQQANGVVEVSIHIRDISPSDKYIKVQFDGEKVWMKTAYLEQIFLEKLPK